MNIYYKVLQKGKKKDSLCYLNKDVRETAFLEGAAVK